jgi:hypothetical protein
MSRDRSSPVCIGAWRMSGRRRRSTEEDGCRLGRQSQGAEEAGRRPGRQSQGAEEAGHQSGHGGGGAGRRRGGGKQAWARARGLAGSPGRSTGGQRPRERGRSTCGQGRSRAGEEHGPTAARSGWVIRGGARAGLTRGEEHEPRSAIRVSLICTCVVGLSVNFHQS